LGIIDTIATGWECEGLPMAFLAIGGQVFPFYYNVHIIFYQSAAIDCSNTIHLHALLLDFDLFTLFKFKMTDMITDLKGELVAKKQ
jgi:hypothetical protein